MLGEINRVVANEAESNVQASNLEVSISASMPQTFDEEMRDAFFAMMNQWFIELEKANHVAPPPPPPIIPPPARP